jgi:hypothetical protein
MMEVIVSEGKAFLKTMDGALKTLGPVVESSASVEELEAQATPLEIVDMPAEPPMGEAPMGEDLADAPMDMPMEPAPVMPEEPPMDMSSMPVRKRLEAIAGKQFEDKKE